MPELSLGMALYFARFALCFFAALKTIKPVNQSISRLFEYPRGESNPNLKNRNLQFYPLNYGGSFGLQI